MRKFWKIAKTPISFFKEKAKEKRLEKEKELREINQLDSKVKKETKKTENISMDSTSTWFIFKFWIAFAIIAYLSYIIFNSLSLVYLILAAFIISIAMESIIELFERFLKRGIAILISYIFILTLLISGFIVIVPFVAAQTADIIKILLDKVDNFQQLLQNKGLEHVIKNSSYVPTYFKGMIVDSLKNQEVISALQTALQQNVSQIVSFGSSYIKNAGSFAVGALKTFFSAIFQIIIVFTLAIFFSLEKERVIDFIASVSGRKELVSGKIRKLYKKLGFRLKGQLLLTIFIGVTVGILLYTLSFFGIDLPNKFTLALIAGITEFIPLLGPVLGAIPALLVALSSYGFAGFLVIIIMYALVQWAENNILVPAVMNQALGVSALAVLIAIIVGGSALGFIGVVLAVPIAVILTIAFEDLMDREQK